MLFIKNKKEVWEWIATVMSIIGAFILANKYQWAYIIFTCSTAIFLSIFISEKRTPQIVINVFFLIANVIGMWNFFFA